MRVVFFGTPAFAVPALRALVEEGADVVAVVTQPDRPHGRSRSTVVPPPVKQVAEELGLPVLQPERPRGDVFVASLRRLNPDLGVVVAYGHILKPEVLAIPTRGMVNVHASLLPRYRGAAPVHAAILAGDRTTGITIMQMDAGMDTGAILHQVPTDIGETETGGQLTERLADLGARALIEALVLLQRGELLPVPQDGASASLAPKIDRDTARIDWAMGARAVARRIRAFDPVPGAWTTLGDLEVKLFGAHPGQDTGAPGVILRTEPALVVGTGDGSVEISEVQPSGKRRMPAAEWHRGRAALAGERFA
ncbi:MAG: methionyl-tRNA formyltransferase [Gammaproteobacteria bacterium]|jgi:methionyl-tRNA formyltransferase|nr:methionyl-tRNA formyltransferase [Gammaproteobacteria bacterium]